MLNSRQLDLATLFDAHDGRRWSVLPLLEEKLFLTQSRRALAGKPLARVSVSQLAGMPLILPTSVHGLRSTLESAFARAKCKPTLVAEIDSLAMLMDAVDSGLGCTVQPWAAVGRFADAQERFHLTEVNDAAAPREFAVQPVGRRTLSGRSCRPPGVAGIRQSTFGAFVMAQ